MTPAQRAALHALLDDALNHDAIIGVSIHPRYHEDVPGLLDLLGGVGAVDTSVLTASATAVPFTLYMVDVDYSDVSLYHRRGLLHRPEGEGNPEIKTEVTVATTQHGGAGYVEATGPARPVAPNLEHDTCLTDPGYGA